MDFVSFSRPSFPVSGSSGDGGNPPFDSSNDNNQIGLLPTINFNTNGAFPVRLHTMLAVTEKSPFLSGIVSWRPHGRCFVVENRELFLEHVLPNWFTMATFASFQRQLNMYGFKRLTAGPDKGGYYNEFFLRGQPHLATYIPRQKFKGGGPRRPANPQDEPDFYAKPFMPDCASARGPMIRGNPYSGFGMMPMAGFFNLQQGMAALHGGPGPQMIHSSSTFPTPVMVAAAVVEGAGLQQQQTTTPTSPPEPAAAAADVDIIPAATPLNVDIIPAATPLNFWEVLDCDDDDYDLEPLSTFAAAP